MKNGMTTKQKEQIAAEIDNQGFDYWLQNYTSSLIENNAPRYIIEMAEKARIAIDEVEDLFIKEDLIFN